MSLLGPVESSMVGILHCSSVAKTDEGMTKVVQ